MYKLFFLLLALLCTTTVTQANSSITSCDIKPYSLNAKLDLCKEICMDEYNYSMIKCNEKKYKHYCKETAHDSLISCKKICLRTY